MRPRLFVPPLLALLFAVVPAPAARAGALSCPAGTGPVPMTLTTGVDEDGNNLPAEAVEQRWRYLPTPTSTAPAYVASPPGSWFYPGVGAAWIKHSPQIDWLTGTLTFEYEFTLGSPQQAGPLSFVYAADNGVTFTLNGTAIGGYVPANNSDPTGFNQLHGISLATPPYVTGVNRLRATVTNYSAWDGLLVWGSVDVCDTQSTCEAYGLLVTPDVPPAPPVVHGHTKVRTRPSVTGVRPAGPMAPPPSPSVASSDALADQRLTDASYDVRAQAAYGECGLATRHRDAWGRAGAAKVSISTPLVPGAVLEIPVAELEAEIAVGAAGEWHDMACRISVVVDGGAVHNACEYLPVDVLGRIRVETGVTWGPAVRADGLTHWGGAAVHVVLGMPSGPDEHVWVGWVDVATVVSPPAYEAS